ncbi:MAG: hypothetical protein OJF47_001797 [Nitrospira sp.]|jgi:hypothetical protein|nr:MAG: hypothetical protein OJF47_001797 [Nitrospira sp.]
MKIASPLAYVGVTALTLTLLSLLYAGAFFYQLGALVSAEYWIYETQIVKHKLLEEHRNTRKILVTAGSSAFFGIDSSRIEATLGIPTINMSIHAGQPVEYLLNEIEPYVSTGDIVVLPLEYEHYSSTTAYNGWFTDQVMAWNQDYFWRLNAYDKLRFMFAVPPQRVLLGVITQSLGDRLELVRKRHLKSPDQILDRFRTAWAQKDHRPAEMYSFLNSDRHGDAIATTPEPQANQWLDPYVLDHDFVESPYFWLMLKDFVVRCRERGVDLYIAWPPIMEGLVDFDAPRISHAVNVIKSRLKELGVQTLGNPSDFQYGRGQFTGNRYHLTKQGKAEHTTRLLGHLLSAIRSVPHQKQYKIVKTGPPARP